jgi:3-hydroxyacyl-[acyl-carrier-protein] dehydratase
MRFSLVDRVVECTAEQVVTLKAVTSAEEYLADHFPRFPVLPGVMMLEAMVQAARCLLAEHPDAPDERWVLAEVRQLRYGNMVRPGQLLQVSVELVKVEADRWHFRGSGQVEGPPAVQGRFILRPVQPGPMGDGSPL